MKTKKRVAKSTLKKESSNQIIRKPKHEGKKDGAQNSAESSRKPTKAKSVLLALMSGRSFNRFEAARELHDWCLHSTISSIQNQHGVRIARRIEVVPGWNGSKVRCCRYWLPEDARKHAEAVLQRLR